MHCKRDEMVKSCILFVNVVHFVWAENGQNCTGKSDTCD